MFIAKYLNFWLCALYNSKYFYFAYFNQKKLQYSPNCITILIIYNNNLITKIAK